MSAIDLIIQVSRRTSDSIEVLLAGASREPASVTFDYEGIKRFANILADPLGRKGRVTLQELVDFGMQLKAMILPEEIADVVKSSYHKLPLDHKLRIRLVLTDPELSQIPWEYLFFPLEADNQSMHGFLVLNSKVSLVRHEPLMAAEPSMHVAHPLHILAAGASPLNLPLLDIERDLKNVREAIAESPEFHYSETDKLTRESLVTAGQQAHIFHYSGHAKFGIGRNDDVTALQAGQPQGFLQLFDAAIKGSEDFPAEKLAVNLASMRLVVLSACESSKRDDVEVWSGLAPAIIQSGVPAVLAMQFPVFDKAAMAFNHTFYKSLGVGHSVDEAVYAGRLAILNLQRPFDFDWGVPTLYMRSKNGVLFNGLADDPKLDSAREAHRTVIQNYVESVAGRFIGAIIDPSAPGKTDVINKTKTVEKGGVFIGSVLTKSGQIKDDSIDEDT